MHSTSLPPHAHSSTDHQQLHGVAHGNLQPSTQDTHHEHVLLHEAESVWLPWSEKMAEEAGLEETKATAGPCSCQHVPLGPGSCQL